jgi:hypothetical protein
MIVFRQADPRFPVLRSGPSQPAGRWHGAGEGPAHYFADTPHGAWAELLRHEEIDDPGDVATIRRAIWTVDIGDTPAVPVSLRPGTTSGGLETYEPCQAHARRLRARGTERLSAPSAALVSEGASGRRVLDGLERDARAPPSRAAAVGWAPRAPRQSAAVRGERIARVDVERSQACASACVPVSIAPTRSVTRAMR